MVSHVPRDVQGCWCLVTVEVKHCMLPLLDLETGLHCMCRLIVLVGNQPSSTQVKARGEARLFRVDAVASLWSVAKKTPRCSASSLKCGISKASSHADISKIMFAHKSFVFAITKLKQWFINKDFQNFIWQMINVRLALLLKTWFVVLFFVKMSA